MLLISTVYEFLPKVIPGILYVVGDLFLDIFCCYIVFHQQQHEEHDALRNSFYVWISE